MQSMQASAFLSPQEASFSSGRQVGLLSDMPACSVYPGAFLQAVREAAERRATNAAAAARPAPAESSPAPPPAPLPLRRPMLAVRARVKVKPAAAQPAAAADGAQAAAPTAVEPAGKRRRVEPADNDSAGLARLVGGYGSDSSGG
jgi:hypothetical protein